MSNLAAKWATLWRILQTDPQPWRIVRERVTYNSLLFRLNRAEDGWFRYRTKHGFDFVVDRHEPQTFWMHAQGHPDLGELSILQRWCQPGDVCIDVGANIGFMTALLAARVGPTGIVFAVEPGTETFAKLTANVARLRLHNVRPLQSCVGAKTGSAEFFVSTNPSLSPLQSLHRPVDEGSSFVPVSVPITRVDDLVAEFASTTPISTIKIDVEGAERDVLLGSDRLLACENPPLFDLEINRESMLRSGSKVSRLASLFGRNHELLYVNLSDRSHPFPLHRLIPLPAVAEENYPRLGSLIAVPLTGRFAVRRASLASLGLRP